MAKSFQDKLDTQKEIKFIFSETGESSVPYHEDGDPSMYTEDSLSKRAELKLDPLVSKALKDLSLLFPFQQDRLYQVMYQKVMMAVASVLRPELETEALQELVDKEWERESQGKTFISEA